MLKDKKGISPIVGVILVVAMTVLLAAIAWTYLGGLASSGPSRVYQVGVTVKQIDRDTITITYIGGADKDKLIELRFRGINQTGGNMRFYAAYPQINETVNATFLIIYLYNIN